jgi:4-amino-4-deoxy-L-arabinose transferase-like glycosyltransferase
MSANPTSRVIPFVLLLVLAAAIFLGGLGRLPLFGRDESLYAEAAREMAASGDWVTPRVNGGAFFEKPPLYYWMAAASYRVFGVSPFAARLPAALAGILSVVLVALIGARVWGRRAGLLAGLALATCLQMAIVGRMGIMDMPLAFLTILAMLAYARWVTKAGLLWAVAFGACVGLGVLLKGAAGGIPVGIALMDLAVRAAWGKRLRPSLTIGSIGRAAVALVVSGGIAAPWFMAMSARHGAAFSGTFLVHEHLRRIMQPMQGHGGPFWIYFWVYVPLIAFGFFPWVVLLPAGMLSRPVEETEVAAR